MADSTSLQPPPSGADTATRFFLGPLGGTLERAEIALRDLFEHTRDAVILIDQANVIRYWNQGAERMFQYSRQEVLGRRIGFLVPPDLLETGELEWIRSRIEAEGCLCNFVTRRVRKDGVERWVSLTRSVLHDIHGEGIGSTAVFRDVTEERLLQEELAHARGMAIVGEMSVTLAHEIKNRLAGIYGAIQLLSKKLATGDPNRAVFEEVTAEIKRLDETACDLLRYARPGPPRRKDTDLAAWVGAVLVSLEPASELRRQDIGVSVPRGLRASIDPELLGQALQSLLLNAGQAMDRPGRIHVEVRARGGSIEIEVIDGGTGIPEGLLPSIFQPFFTTKSRGTGLGLSIAQKNVEAHGGTISVASEAGKGSRFTIRIPGTALATSPSMADAAR